MTEQAQQSRYTGINAVTLEGNLTRDSEVKTVNTRKGDAQVLEARMAFNTLASNGTKPNYIDIAIWGEKRAQALLSKLKKGTPVVVQGTLNLNTSGENGNTRVFPQVVVDKIHTPRGGNGSSPAPDAEPAAATAGGSDDDIPF